MKSLIFILFSILLFVCGLFQISAYCDPFISVDGYIWINNPELYIANCRVFITDMENKALFAIAPSQLGQLEAVLTNKMKLQKHLPKICSHWTKIFLSVQVLNKKTHKAITYEVNYNINLFSFNSCKIKQFLGNIKSTNRIINVNDFHTWHFIGYYHW